jgi:lipoprotein-releasing system permease protein
VQIEKNMMFIILSLIVAVAAFNLVSTLVMAVTDKQADIAILRTLGARPLSIMAIFVVQGALVGFIGLGLGIVGGVALALNIDVVVPFIERACWGCISCRKRSITSPICLPSCNGATSGALR